MNRKAAAFTLKELLVTIGIMLMLAALLMPTLGRTLGEGRKVACQNNLRQIYTAFNAFSIDNNNRWPARVGLNDDATVQGNFVYFTRPYLDANNNYGQWANGKGKVYICPELYRIHKWSAATSYAINGRLFESFSRPELLNRARITRPAGTVLLGDGCWIGGQFTSWIDETRLPGQAYPVVQYEKRSHGNGGGNLLFCDGHVEYWPDTSVLLDAKYRNGSASDVWSLK